ncbi:MAG: type II toxin-antitoxin system Phd/YefM family antitoxin [Desulfuromusa sp.]|nr:type II toxin-antitoxin system Phd/YefM family antitoxin [Desulfuromusa sp.]
MQIDNYIPVTKAKAKLLDMIRDIDSSDDTIAITKNGVPQAIIMSIDQYEAMCETISIMADTNTMEQIQTSINEIEEHQNLIDLEGTK